MGLTTSESGLFSPAVMIFLFPDTNFFLQCIAAPEIPWREVFDQSEIRLLVSRTVMIELDRLKQDGNSRRAKRARAASATLRELVKAHDHVKTVREAGPRIEIGLAPRLNPTRQKPESLDLSHSDDRMIEEIIAYSAEHDDHDVALLTNDTNPMLTAREHCLNCYEIPEAWLLAPESDEKEKEILKLKTLLAEASKKLPQIEIRVLGAAMEALPQIKIRMVQYGRLEESRIAELQIKSRS